MAKTTEELESHAIGALRAPHVSEPPVHGGAAPLPAPDALPGHAAHAMQKSLGNVVTREMLQPKLTVGAPNDIYEKEADAVADQVLARASQPAPAPGVGDGRGPAPGNSGKVADQEAAQQTAQRSVLRQIPISTLQQSLGNRAFARFLEETNTPAGRPDLKRASSGAAGAARADAGQEAPPIVEDVLATTGQPLADSARRTLEPGFGHDFGGVRVHDDSKAAESASSVNALAYTVGNHIVFGAGQYAPGTGAGDRLLAHELTHTIQQNGAAPAGNSVSRLSSEEGGTVQRDPTTPTATTATTTPAATTAPASSTTPAAAPAAATIGPKTVTTAYGTFSVYPDDFIGPLAAPDRAAGNWPVRQSEFDRIKSSMDSISAGTSAVKITGDTAFKAAVLLDLAWVQTVSVGRDLINSIVGSGKTLTIEATSGGNATSYSPDSDSWENEDHTRGTGADTTISYNTVETNPYGGAEAWMTRPPAIGLAHEMIHAWTGMIGTRARGETGGVRNREMQATGLGAYKDAVYSENRFRAAFGLPLRPRY